MVLGNEVAVIVTARRGKNWLVHTRGIDIKHVLQSSQDVASFLEKGSNDEGSHGRVSGATTASSYGQVVLKGTRYTAVYRVINKLVVMTLSQQEVNVFNAINLVSTITRLLLYEFKGADVSLEKMSTKKMAQVYLAIDAIISRGYLEMNPALSDAISQLEGYHKTKSLKSPKDAAILTPTAPPPLQSRRRVIPQSDAMKGFSFDMPQEVQDLHTPPPPQHNITMDLTSAKGDPFAAGGDPFAASGAAASDDPFASSDPFGQPPAGDPLAGLTVPSDPSDPLAGLEVGPKGFSTDAFGEGAQWGGQSAPGSAHPSTLPSPAMSVHRLSTQDLSYMPSAPLLLREIWRGEVHGSTLVKAGVKGQVQWASEDVRSLSPSMGFAVLAPEFPDSLLKKALQCSQLNRVTAATGSKPGTFLAQSVAATSASTPMLYYQLPASFCKPPLTVQCGFTCTEVQSGAALVLVGFSYAVQPTILHPMQDLIVDIQLPASMAEPKRMEPEGEWGRLQSTARWTIKKMSQGSTGSVAVLVLCAGGPRVAYQALKDVRITARLRGKQGQSLSGTSICQAAASAALVPTTEACVWEAQLNAVLDVPESPYAF